MRRGGPAEVGAGLAGAPQLIRRESGDAEAGQTQTEGGSPRPRNTQRLPGKVLLEKDFTGPESGGLWGTAAEREAGNDRKAESKRVCVSAVGRAIGKPLFVGTVLTAVRFDF